MLKIYSKDYVKKRASGRQVLYNEDGTPEKIILMGGPEEKMERVGEYPIGRGDTLTLKRRGALQLGKRDVYKRQVRNGLTVTLNAGSLFND